ncbi:MAG: YlxR family protein [Actinomycetota bacterium]
MRTCVGCRAVRPQQALHRCVRTADGAVHLDRRGVGRGAWLCSAACLPLAVKRRAFDRALRAPVAPASLEALARTFESISDNMRESLADGVASPAPTPMKG